MIKFAEFLRSAEKLLEKESVEVEYRNAASRAYYAAYHGRLDLSQRSKIEPVKSEGGVHQQLINGLCLHQDVRVKTVGYALKQLKRQRVKADYKLEQDFTLRDAQFTVESTQKLLRELNQI
jgi:uncharacterized protein (UPF0332 family)